MTPRTLRARVALSAAVAILVALALLTVVVSALLSRELHHSLDTTLRQRAGEVARLSATAPALLTRPGALDSQLSGNQILVQVLDRHGRTVARSTALNGDTLQAGALTREALTRVRSGYANTTRGDTPLRLFVAPLAATGGPASGGAVVVATSIAQVDDTLEQLRHLGLLSLIGAAILGAALATVLARRALRPLERLSTAAADIERTGDASRRLPEPPHRDDEVGRLATTLNAMLAALERAREAERRFVGDASHELRTPLTALRGNAAFVARHGADPTVLADIEHDAERLSALIDDLLALAREDAATPPAQDVRLDELAHEVAERHATSPIDVHAAEPVTVAGDAAALARALDNLVENAERHGPPGGRIRIDVGTRDGRAELSVTDDGEGLSPDEAAHAFERFWRSPASRATPGTGLGLAIVRATVERHGGTAAIDGSRVTLRLPARQAAGSHGSFTDQR
jgi:signal transduction histidine kinase